MNTWNIRGRSGALVLLALAAVVPPGALKGADHNQAQGGSIVGTWFTQVTRRDCASNAEIVSFPAINAFTKGGTLIDTTAGATPTGRSPGLGYWEKTGGGTYTAVSIAFLFNAAGVLTGTQKLTQAIELRSDRSQFTSTAANEIFDTNGVRTVVGCATAVGRLL
jgi:hypothetical protein